MRRQPVRSPVFSADPGLLRIELIKEAQDLRGGPLEVNIVEAVAIIVGDERAVLDEVVVQVLGKLTLLASVLKKTHPRPQNFLLLRRGHEFVIRKLLVFSGHRSPRDGSATVKESGYRKGSVPAAPGPDENGKLPDLLRVRYFHDVRFGGKLVVDSGPNNLSVGPFHTLDFVGKSKITIHNDV